MGCSTYASVRNPLGGPNDRDIPVRPVNLDYCAVLYLLCCISDGYDAWYPHFSTDDYCMTYLSSNVHDDAVNSEK